MSAVLDPELLALLDEARADAQTFDADQKRANKRRYYEEHREDIAANKRRWQSQVDPLTLAADKHGRASTYSNWRCRCEPCREAWRIVCRQRRERARAARAVVFEIQA